jgi:hypothetical protein
MNSSLAATADKHRVKLVVIVITDMIGNTTATPLLQKLTQRSTN